MSVANKIHSARIGDFFPERARGTTRTATQILATDVPVLLCKEIPNMDVGTRNVGWAQ